MPLPAIAAGQHQAIMTMVGKEYGVQYYLADGDRQRGPFTVEQLPAQGLRPDTLVWREGMTGWQRADSVPELQPLFATPDQPPAVPPVPGYGYGPVPYNPSEVNGKKIVAGICGIFLGQFGVHKFVLGLNTQGVIMLLVSLLTCGVGGVVMWAIGLIEGILYLTKSDYEFYQTYIVQKKGWF